MAEHWMSYAYIFNNQKYEESFEDAAVRLLELDPEEKAIRGTMKVCMDLHSTVSEPYVTIECACRV